MGGAAAEDGPVDAATWVRGMPRGRLGEDAHAGTDAVGAGAGFLSTGRLHDLGHAVLLSSFEQMEAVTLLA